MKGYKMRLIGDVHGHIGSYVNIIKDCEQSIQLGDMGFKSDYEEMTKLFRKENIDPKKHMFIPGNHDDYNHLPENAFKGAFNLLFGNKVMTIRGEESIDKQWRVEGVSWWRNEEISYSEAGALLDNFEKYKPTCVLSHGCPTSALFWFMTNDLKSHGSMTSRILQKCLEIHRPKLWIFGHHHITKTYVEKRTKFMCLNELDFMDIEI